MYLMENLTNKNKQSESMTEPTPPPKTQAARGSYPDHPTLSPVFPFLSIFKQKKHLKFKKIAVVFTCYSNRVDFKNDIRLACICIRVRDLCFWF